MPLENLPQANGPDNIAPTITEVHKTICHNKLAIDLFINYVFVNKIQTPMLEHRAGPYFVVTENKDNSSKNELGKEA